MVKESGSSTLLSQDTLDARDVKLSGKIGCDSDCNVCRMPATPAGELETKRLPTQRSYCAVSVTAPATR